MTSITIKLPEAMKEKLEAEARIRGKSCSALIRDSLETKMKRP
jgi:predicted transcriptional regulator